MSFHMLANFVSIGQTADTDVPALADQIITISNGHWQPQSDWDIVAAMAFSVTLNRARIVSPSNRQVTNPLIRPIEQAVTPGSDYNIADYRRTPFRIRGLEELAIEATSDLAMGNENLTTLMCIQQRFDPIPPGNAFSMRGTSTTASVANTWTEIIVTWADILAEGVYAVVGLDVFGATEQAARIIFQEQRERPGCVGLAAIGGKPHEMFLKGGLGEWGRFRSTAMPQIQVLNNAAVAVHTLNMEIIRVA